MSLCSVGASCCTPRLWGNLKYSRRDEEESADAEVEWPTILNAA